MMTAPPIPRVQPLAHQRLLAEALKYHALGWCVLPARLSGPKAKGPAVRWKHYTEGQLRPGPDDLRHWFAHRRHSHDGLGVITGPASGGLIVRDWDSTEPYEHWADAHPGLAVDLPTAQTHRGWHAYALAEWQGGTVMLPDGELRWNAHVVLPPSPHPEGGDYRWLTPPEVGRPLPMIDPHSVGWVPPDCQPHSRLDPPTTEREDTTEEILSVVSSALSLCGRRSG
jgi:hypothetical protein